MPGYNDITLHLKITHQQEQDMEIFSHYGFDAIYLGDALDRIFDAYLWAQHENESDDFFEAHHLHYAVMNVKKILRGIAPALKEALTNKAKNNDGK